MSENIRKKGQTIENNNNMEVLHRKYTNAKKKKLEKRITNHIRGNT